ncbi:polysaccharide biosynthesis tyrosine autokinase [Clostridium tertium]
MEPEILKFEDIIKGCIKKWKSILVFAICTTILAAIVSGASNEIITYQGNFKTLIKSDVLVNDNGTIVKKDPNLIQNYIEVMKTRNFAENVIKRAGLELTPQQVLTDLSLVNISNSDFVQVKYSSEDKEQTEKVITAIKDELLAVAKDYSEDAEVSIEENVGITEKTDIRNNKLLVLMGLIGGLGLGFVAAFVLECLNKTFKTKGELEREIKLPIIADIPKSKKGCGTIISKDKCDEVFIESYKSLVADLKFSKENSNNKIISITSALKGEGSSTISTNLALALSESNKVMLIDGDLINPSIAKYLNIDVKKGLEELISGNSELKDSEVKINDNLMLISPVSTNNNGMALFDSKEFLELLEKLKNKYDFIIIDTPPFKYVSDTKVLIKNSDGVILNIKAESTKKDIVKSTIKEFNSLGTNITGLAFNFGDRFRNSYYQYRK